MDFTIVGASEDTLLCKVMKIALLIKIALLDQCLLPV